VEAVFSQDRGITSVRQAKGTMIFVDYDDTRCATRLVQASWLQAVHAHGAHALLRKCMLSGYGGHSLAYAAVAAIPSCGSWLQRAELAVASAFFSGTCEGCLHSHPCSLRSSAHPKVVDIR
jgi:hypothetical protein